MTELDRFIIANPSRIPCTVRTLKPFRVEGTMRPWVHSGEIMDAVLYLGSRAGLPDDEIRALKELLERLSCLLKDSSDSQDLHQADHSEST